MSTANVEVLLARAAVGAEVLAIIEGDLRGRLSAAVLTHACEPGGSDDHERGFGDGWNAALEFSARAIRERP